MPYTTKFIEGGSKPWKIVKVDTRTIVGSSKTKKDAEASIRARMSGEKK